MILHVDTGREHRGGQTQLRYLVAGSDDVVALPPDAAVRPHLDCATEPVAFRGIFRGTRTLAGLVRRLRPDAVAAHTSHAHGHALLAVRGTDVPVLVHRRNDFVPSSGPVSRWKYRAPRGYIAVSEAVRGVLSGAGMDADRIAVVHDGVAITPDPDPVGLRAELGLDPHVRLVLAVGARVQHKGHVHLVHAADRLPDDVVVLVAGEGSLVYPHPRVRWLGHRDDVGRLLASVDVFVHPSVEEGLGQAVLEAMLCGTPVVATTAGGVPEVVQDQGRLVPPGDPRALAEALAAMLAHPTAPDPTHAARFGVSAMVDGTRSTYDAFLVTS